MNLHLVPAYGRDYKSKKAVLEDWNAGKDFEAVGITGSGYINKTGAQEQGVTSVNIRYKRLTQVTVIAVPKPAVQCADCGRIGQTTGHQECQHPQDH